jgi:hypothetical protein
MASKRDQIIAALKEGEASHADLLALAMPDDPKSDKAKKALSSQFTILRLMGIYPVKNEDGTYRTVSQEEWDNIQEEAKANRKAPSRARSPKEKLEVAQRKVERAKAAVARTTKALKATPKDKLAKLKHQYAEIGLDIALMEQENDEAVYRPMVEEDRPVEEPVEDKPVEKPKGKTTAPAKGNGKAKKAFANA